MASSLEYHIRDKLILAKYAAKRLFGGVVACRVKNLSSIFLRDAWDKQYPGMSNKRRRENVRKVVIVLMLLLTIMPIAGCDSPGSAQQVEPIVENHNPEKVVTEEPATEAKATSSTVVQATTSLQPTASAPSNPPSSTKPANSAPVLAPNTSITYPKPYSWVALKPLTVSWTVGTEISRPMSFSLYLTDLKTGRQTYQEELNFNSNFPQAMFKDGVYSWTIPATVINGSGYTLEERHKYRLSLTTFVVWDGTGLSPYRMVEKTLEFTVDSRKADIPPPSGPLAVLVKLQAPDAQHGNWLGIVVSVMSGDTPVPDANVTVTLKHPSQSYPPLSLVTMEDGGTAAYVGVFDQNPITVEVTAKAAGQSVSKSTTFTP